MHCFPANSPHNSEAHPSQRHARPQSSPHGSHDADARPLADVHRGEIPAWESCGRIVAKERGDFFEFVACNVGIAIVAVGLVFVRSKRLQAMQARQLAARIGLVRPAPGGWAAG